MVARTRVAAVTGAGAGLGRAITRALAAEGWAVGLIGRNRDGLEATAAEVGRLGAKALVVPADVADATAVEAAVERIELELGPIDVWVNNAMVTVFSPIDRITPEEFKRVTEVTYLGTVHGTMAALRRMRARGRGTIVQVGSALAYRSIPLQAAYCGAKAAVRGFTDSLRSELIHEGSAVRITMVQMPALNTPQFDWARNKLPRRVQPVPPIFDPEIGARAVLLALKSTRREIWVGWPTIRAVLANRIAPGLLDRLAAHTAWGGQMGDAPADPEAPDNLFSPLPGDRGADGRFGRQAQAWSPALWVSAHRGTLAFALLASLGGLLLGRALVRRS
jgi:short-subunit dehydrogenase